jgi:hypothetical protein
MTNLFEDMTDWNEVGTIRNITESLDCFPGLVGSIVTPPHGLLKTLPAVVKYETNFLDTRARPIITSIILPCFSSRPMKFAGAKASIQEFRVPPLVPQPLVFFFPFLPQGQSVVSLSYHLLPARVYYQRSDESGFYQHLCRQLVLSDQ